MGDLRAEIARLRSLTPQLNAVTDRAAKIVQAVEHFLNEECQLAISASIDTNVTYSPEGDYRGGHLLEYARWEGKFRIIVSDFLAAIHGDIEISERTLWANATRERKLATINAIPDLLREISRCIESTIKGADEQATVVEDYLKDLGIKGVGL